MRDAVITFLFVVAALSAGNVRAADLPACSSVQRHALHVSAEEADRHRRFDLPVVDYPPTDRPEFDLQQQFVVRVDEDGRVVCFVEPGPDTWPEPLTPRQRVLLRQARSWRYQPFLRDGRPVAVITSQRYHEQILPQRRVSALQVPLDQVSITFVQGQHFFGGHAYAVHIRGDGWVGFHAMAGTDVEGTFAYRVPGDEVAKLVAHIRNGDLWSAADNYHGKVTDQATRRLTVRFGKHTKTITDYAGRAIGMPSIVTQVQEAAARVARADQWTTLSEAALDRLQRDGFDFKSPAAGRMLARAVLNRRARDDGSMLRLLTLGAPIDAPIQEAMLDRRGPETSLIEHALFLRRTRLIGPLIARGALNTRGRPDQRKIDAAFRAAIVGGRLEPLQQVWAAGGSQLHPTLIYRDEPEFPKAPAKDGVPVALLLDRDDDDLNWEGLEIARWLATKGDDLNAVGANGRTLLEAAANDDDARFVKYLLERGADPTASGRYDYSAVGSAKVEDVALALLEAGSELPRWFRGYRFEAKERGWSRVVAWLDAHPSAPIMPLTEREREDADRERRSRERIKNSPCWQRWIAEQRSANAIAKAKGARRAESVPLYCLCGGGSLRKSAARASSDAKLPATATSQSCAAD